MASPADVEKCVGIAKTLIDAGIALADARKKRRDEEKDRRIKELEAENARLKAGAA